MIGAALDPFVKNPTPESTVALLNRPRPFHMGCAEQGESLASYLFRLAMQNGYQRISGMFYERGLGFSDLAVIDRGADSGNLLGLLSDWAEIDRDELGRLMLCDEVDGLLGDPTHDGRPWLLNGHRASPRQQASLHAICPCCLAEDNVPYWRRSWRLALTTTCQRHHRQFIDRCPGCDAVIGISAARATPLTDCPICLRPYLPADQAITKGRLPPWWAHPPGIAGTFPVSMAMPAQWWMGVRNMLNVLCSDKHSERLLRSPLASHHKIVLRQVRRYGRQDFCCYPLPVRHGLLKMIAALTADWPGAFVHAMKSAGLTMSCLSSSELPAPWWLADTCARHLSGSRYSPSVAEVRTASLHLSKAGLAPSKIRLKRLLGVTEAKAIGACGTPGPQLGADKALEVVRLLDKDLLALPTAREEQACALRDACCLAIAMWTGVSFATAVKTDMHAYARLRCELKAASGSSALPLTTLEQIVRTMLRWLDFYTTGVRPRFERYERREQAFLLTRYGLPDGGNGMPGRFADLLRRAGVADWSRGARLLVGRPLRRIDV